MEIIIKKTKIFFSNAIRTVLLSCLMLASAQSAKPLWTIELRPEPDFRPMRSFDTIMIYTVHNESQQPKTLVMKPIAGVTQDKPCQLTVNGSCTLALYIKHSDLQGDVLGGPVLCQQGSELQCYQPIEDILHIAHSPVDQQFNVTRLAGANGSMKPSIKQQEAVNAGSTLTYTATPEAGFGVHQWLLDGKVVQNGGTIFQLNNIQADHTLEVTFNETTLSPHTQSLALSINSPGADPALLGNARIIRIENTGSIAAENLRVSPSRFPEGTSITSDGCEGTLDAGATCDITITPGATASPDKLGNACTTSLGTEPVPTTVTVSADGVPSTDINVLVLGYGCIYQGGFLFSVDDFTVNIGSIGGKVAAMSAHLDPRLDPNEAPDKAVGGISEKDSAGVDSCVGKDDGKCNTGRIIAINMASSVAVQHCKDLISGGFTDWYLPAICELGRYIGSGDDAGCGIINPNLYTTLHTNNLGGLANDFYWSSTEFGDTTGYVWIYGFGSGIQSFGKKQSPYRVRCVRSFIP